jgi:hypothetical protein
MNPLTNFGAYTKAVLDQAQSVVGWKGAKADERVEDYIQKGANGATEYLSIGPGYNEISTFYEYGPGGHHLRFLNLVSPDILLVHQSRMVGFYRVTGTQDEIRVVQRDLKDLIVKDVNITL